MGCEGTLDVARSDMEHTSRPVSVKAGAADADTKAVRSLAPRIRTMTAFIVLTVTIVVSTVAPAYATAGFGDVDPDDYFAAAVQWMTDRGYIEGISPGCFGPGVPTTRGDMATLLHRVNGEPDAEGGEPFDDVGPYDPFFDAVVWLYQTGVTVGTSPTTFSPDDVLTRGQIATFLHRIAGEPDTGSESFVDVAEDDWFRDAVAWMVDEGITVGTTSDTFSPYLTVTRAHVVTFLYRSVGEPAVTLDESGDCDPYPNLAEAEALSFSLLNELRSDLGLVQLVRDPEMDAAAREWSRVMEETGEFKHSGLPWAENIAWWSADWKPPADAATLFNDLWIDSDGHYRNMTNTRWRRVGIGFWVGDGGWYATHVFSR